MAETQMTSPKRYIMQTTGGLNLSSDALRELGWKRRKTWVDQYIDLKRNRLIIVKRGTSISGLSKDIADDVHSLFRTYPIGQLGYMSIDRDTRQRLGWELGGEHRETLDMNLKGIIITKVDDSGATEDPLANTVKLSELDATKEKERNNGV